MELVIDCDFIWSRQFYRLAWPPYSLLDRHRHLIPKIGRRTGVRTGTQRRTDRFGRSESKAAIEPRREPIVYAKAVEIAESISGPTSLAYQALSSIRRNQVTVNGVAKAVGVLPSVPSAHAYHEPGVGGTGTY
jgi:hypothetical protein